MKVIADHVANAANGKTWDDFPAPAWVDWKNGPHGATEYKLQQRGVWYLPIRTELNDFFNVYNGSVTYIVNAAAREAFNSILIDAGGDPWSDNVGYWTSSRYSSSTRVHIYTVGSNGIETYGEDALHETRAMMAF
jgi:hypothetical protein